jgi:hypothetical protein
LFRLMTDSWAFRSMSSNMGSSSTTSVNATVCVWCVCMCVCVCLACPFTHARAANIINLLPCIVWLSVLTSSGNYRACFLLRTWLKQPMYYLVWLPSTPTRSTSTTF